MRFRLPPTAARALPAAVCAQAAAALLQFGLASVGPEIQARYHLTISQLGALLSAYLLGNGLFLYPTGFIVDRYGPRTVAFAGGALATAGVSAAAFATTRGLLFIALLTSGIGSAAIPVVGTRAIYDAYAASSRASAFGVRQTAVPLGGLVAVVLVPTLDTLGGLRLALLTIALLTAISSAWLALISAAERPPAPSPGLGLRRILRTPGMSHVLLIAALYILVVQAIIVYTVPAARAAGLSPLLARSTLFGMTVAAIGGRIVWGRVADRAEGANRGKALVLTGCLSALGGAAFTVGLHFGAIATLLTALIFAFGAFGWNAVVYVSAAEFVPPDLISRALSLTFALVFLLSGFGTPLLGTLVESVGWDALWVTAAILSGLGALASTRLPTPALQAVPTTAARLDEGMP